MNIFLISRGIPSKCDPQWGCFEKDQAEALASLGHRVIVLSVDGRFRLYKRKVGITYTKIGGIEYFNIFFIPGIFPRKLGGIKLELFIYRKLLDSLFAKVVRLRGKPDILYSHYLTNTYIASFIKKKYNLPLVAIEHWSKMMYPFSPHLRKIISYSYKNVDKLIAVSKPLKERIYAAFKKDSIVIPNMLGREFFKYKEKEIEEGRVVNFISIGSLLPVKSYDTLITAFSNLDLPHDKWHLTIIGDGPLKNRLLERSKGCGLESNITFEGRKTKEEIVEFLSDSDVFVLASKSETFGVVFIEALSQGLPCIATLCGGPEDIINDSNGLLVPLGDMEKLQQAITYMYFHHLKYDRKRIAEECYNKYSPKIVANKLTDVFDEVLKENSES